MLRRGGITRREFTSRSAGIAALAGLGVGGLGRRGGGLEFRGYSLLFAAFLLTLPVPFVVFYVPNYILISRLGLLDSFPGLILPQIASAYGIFLLRQHFKAFPQAVIDADRVDGASEWSIVWRVVLPANRAAIVALAVFVFIITWNEFVWPFLVARDPSMYIMAAAALATIPTLLAYLFIRKQILSVLTEGAVKG